MDQSFESGDDPLGDDAPEAWDRLIAAVGPASLLVIIRSRMGTGLQRVVPPEDVLQQTLLRAWEGRHRLEWRGLRSFRSWLLKIVGHCIADAARATRDGRVPIPFTSVQRPHDGSDAGLVYAGPVRTTTPSRLARHAEQARVMQTALESLPDDLGAVVRLRLFEQLTLEAIADHLGIGVAAVRHRLRRGAEAYRHRIRVALASRSGADLAESTALGRSDNATTP